MAYLGQQQALQPGGPANVPQVPAIVDIGNKLQSLHEQALMLRQRMADFSERMHGASGEKQSGTGPTQVPNGMLAATVASIDGIRATLGECQTIMNRIEVIG